MSHVIGQATSKGEPTVRRPAAIGEPFTAVHQQQLDGLIETPSRALAHQCEHISELELRTLAPLIRLAEEDVDAAVASRALSKLKHPSLSVEPIVPAAADHLGWDHHVGGLFPDIDSGTNLIVLPYDFTIDVPTHEEATLTQADRHNGTFRVKTMGGPNLKSKSVWATAGVGTVLEATTAGVARIRAPMQYDYYFGIGKSGLSALTRGHIEMLVTDSETGEVLGPNGRRTKQLWSTGAEGGVSTGGMVWPPDIEATVTLSAGQVFNVECIAHTFINQSGSYTFTWAYAYGELKVQASFFVVELD